jgi:hypothetical protein
VRSTRFGLSSAVAGKLQKIAAAATHALNTTVDPPS